MQLQAKMFFKVVLSFMLLLHFALCHPVHEKVPGSSAKLHSVVKTDGTYSFHAGADPDNFYITNADTFLQSDGFFYSVAAKTLTMSGSKSISGSDATGTYEGTVFSYKGGNTSMEAQILIYNSGEFVRFTQSFPDGLKKCNVTNLEGVLSSFPSFNIGTANSTKSLGFLNSFGDMFGYGYEIGSIEKYQSIIEGGQRSGPLLLFDTKGNVMIMSSYSNFMAHFMEYETKSGIASFGVMGGVSELPVNFQIDTILYYSSEGINKAIENWGQVLTRRYHKMRHTMESDFTINYLGYWTDNGAFYYYNTEKGKNYEQTIKDVASYAKSNDIPYGYIQYDSWWYYKGIGDGVKNWTSMPSVFPNGMDALFDSHGLPVSAHNRYWAADTTYAKKNGGSYDFFVEDTKAIPYDKQFWKDLMRSSKTWGLVTYEQDWLDEEFMDLKVTHTNVTLGRDWLMEMGAAAGECDLTIQYCMGLPRHMMQSVEIQAVTQARVSGDYQPGNTQWRIGVTSMFAHALHIAPFKDTFWSTTSQEGSPYGLHTEPNTHLQSAIATLSTGPVGPSDKIGEANIPLIMKCCRADGIILKPSRALTSTNDNILKRAFPSMQGMPNTEAEVYTTYSDIFAFTPAGKVAMRFGIALAADLTVKDYSIRFDDMYLTAANPTDTNYVAYQGFPKTDTKIYNLSSSDMLHIPTGGLKDFQLWHVSPLIKLSANTSVAILGEREKWVPVSSNRIRGVEFKGENMLVDIVGRPDEIVTLDFSLGGKIDSVTCKIPTSGVARISVKSMKCF